MPDPTLSQTLTKGRCLMLTGKTPSPDWQEAFGKAGWAVTSQSAVEGVASGTGFYDLALAAEPAGVPPETLRRLKADGALTAAMALGNLTPETAALIDVFLCLDEQAVGLLRRLGKAAHMLPPGGEHADSAREILERHLRYRRERYAPVDWSRISYGHTGISRDQVDPAMLVAWQSEEIPARQRALVQTELEQMYQGNIPKVYQVLADAVRPFAQNPSGAGTAPRLLEIGCASGYYSEILEYLLNRRIDYTGVDYSEPLIRMARSLYPRHQFRVEDGAALPFPDGHFPLAISSCVLLHVPNYLDHIRETARVAAKAVIAHRTPVCRNRPTQYQRKFAYGVETVELLFNEAEILEAFRGAGLALASADEFSADPAKDEYCVTYIFEKAAADAAGDLLDKGEAAFSAGDIEAARAVFLRVERDHPGNPRALNDLGVLACKDGDVGRALDMFRQAYAANPAVPKYLENLVQLLGAMGQNGMSRTLLEAHLRNRPADLHARNLLAGLGGT